jgi:hypothetical protein
MSSLTLDTKEARKADTVNASIRESGKFTGVITRAEKLLSKNNVEGFGLSFKSDDGSTANYLDLYTVKPDGEKLRGLGFVQAILCCTRTKEATEGTITFEKWDGEAKAMVKATADGYPALMGKRIGLLLQKELATNNKTFADVERLNVFGVFEADSEMTASEILDKKTHPEQLSKLVQALMAKPVRDTRVKTASSGHAPATAGGGAFDDFEEDIPFN